MTNSEEFCRCTMCGKEWMREACAGPKIKYCVECRKKNNLRRSNERNKRFPNRPRRQGPPADRMVVWIPAKPLTDYLYSKIRKDKDDWALPNQCEKTYFVEMGQIIGLDDTRMRNLCKPDKLITAHKGDEFAIKAGSHPAIIWGFEVFYAMEPEGGSNPTKYTAEHKENARKRQTEVWLQPGYREARVQDIKMRRKRS